MQDEAGLVIDLQLPDGQVLAAMEIRIKGEDIYANYRGRDGATRAHGSYHKSGQQHTKVGKDYVYWTGGDSGNWAPMKLRRPPPANITGRQHMWVIGWRVGDLPSVLPFSSGAPDLVVSTTEVDLESVLGIEVSVIGPHASERDNIYGFPILGRHRSSNGAITVEAEIFVVPSSDG